jgi:hypothetical protein
MAWTSTTSAAAAAATFCSRAAFPIPNPDAIEEFRIQTTMYDAGYGRDAGANVEVVTKSGTNQFHGAVWEFFRNDIFNANNFFLNQEGDPRPAMKQNQFGGDIGGPILKDRLFFFGSYQGTRQINGLSASSLSSSLFPNIPASGRTAQNIGSVFCDQPPCMEELRLPATARISTPSHWLC